MQYLILVIIIVFVIQVALTMQNIEKSLSKTVEVKECTLHDWSYNKDGKLQCCKCSLLAGTITTNNGEYDE